VLTAAAAAAAEPCCAGQPVSHAAAAVCLHARPALHVHPRQRRPQAASADDLQLQGLTSMQGVCWGGGAN
jgi:hypothetical protein